MLDIDGRDINIKLLTPLTKRDINLKTNNGFKKIVSSIRAIGLIEPLCVYQENDHYIILDGYLRYEACRQMNIETVPCLLYKDKQAYAFNKHVNRLSSFQEMRMLRKAVETIPESEVASTFGLKTIHHRLAPNLISQLHPKARKSFENNLLTKTAAKEFTYVSFKRQAEMLEQMKKMNDYSLALARAMVIKTSPDQRTKEKKQQLRSWAQNNAKRKDVVARLEKAEKQHDFYQKLYRQYSTDLMTMAFFIRKLITNKQVKAYLTSNHPDVCSRFHEIVFEGE